MSARQQKKEGLDILASKQKANHNIETLDLTIARKASELPRGVSAAALERFLHEEMVPWEDARPDIARALVYAFSDRPGEGGFVTLLTADEKLLGAVVILDTGMSGYVPAHLLLFAAVREDQRGKGLGSRLIREALGRCSGDVKLHVEYDNPAKRLYERLGFESAYAEMRLRR